MTAVSACANRISLIEHPEIAPFVPDSRMQEVVAVDGGFVVLIRERLASGNVHFHLDAVKPAVDEPVPEATTSWDRLQETFDVLLGKTLHVNFASRFLVSAVEMPPVSLIRILNAGGIKINNTTASLSVATLKLSDSVFNQIKWKQIDRGGQLPPDFLIEISGQLGPMPVTSDLLIIAMGRASEGLQRFVMPVTTPRSI